MSRSALLLLACIALACGRQEATLKVGGQASRPPDAPALTPDLLLESVGNTTRIPNELIFRVADCSAQTSATATGRIRTAVGEDAFVTAEPSTIDPCLTRVTLRSQTADEEKALVAKAMSAIAFDPELGDRVAVSTQALATLTMVPNDPSFPSQWQLKNTGQVTDGANPGIVGVDLNVLPAWSRGATGSGVIVAVVDTGIDLAHPDLTGNIWPGCVTTPAQCNLATQTSDLSDAYLPHGTPIAGIISATANNNTGVAGVAYGAQVMPLRVWKPVTVNGLQGFTTTEQLLVEAIAFARMNGAKVVNLSLGFLNSYYPATLAQAIASANDVVFVAGAGNDGTDAFFYPAALARLPGFPNVISVAAIDSRGQLAEFFPGSSTNYGSWVNLAAPGKLVLTTGLGGTYDYFGGTSFATPMVAGAAAVLLSHEPSLTPGQLKDRLMSTAVQLPGQVVAPQKSIGGGRVDVGAAVGPGMMMPAGPTIHREHWGMAGDVPVPAAYRHAGQTDFAVFRPSDRTWYIRQPGGPTMHFWVWGLPDDLPVAADFMNLGRDQICMFRPSDGTWYVLDAFTSAMRFVRFGMAGDQPVPGNHLGDAAADFTVYRPGNGFVYFLDSGGTAYRYVDAGVTGATALSGPYFGNGRDQVALFSSGTWTIVDADGEVRTYQHGVAGDVPFVANLTGTAQLAVFRPSANLMYIGGAAYSWGAPGDVPFVGNFLTGVQGSELLQYRPSEGVWYVLEPR